MIQWRDALVCAIFHEPESSPRHIFARLVKLEARARGVTRAVARGYPARARMPTEDSAKRPRLMDTRPAEPPRSNDRIIDQTLGDDAEHPMRELFERWGLPDRFVRGVSPSWRCKLVPLARTEDEMRDYAVRGVPALASPEYARGVFDAMGGGGGDGGAATADAVSWACDSPWSSFPRPKVAMVGGWGAPGSHLLSDRYMRMVGSFAEVVDGDEPLNLQMFHRDDTTVPVLPERLRWPLPEFFDTRQSPDAPTIEQSAEETDRGTTTRSTPRVTRRRSRRRAPFTGPAGWACRSTWPRGSAPRGRSPGGTSTTAASLCFRWGFRCAGTFREGRR